MHDVLHMERSTDTSNPYHSYLDNLPREVWKERGWKTALDVIESNNMTEGPFFELTPGIWELKTREKINAVLEVDKSVAALTTNCFHEVGRTPKTGEPYFSGDFRDHPEFEYHLDILEKAWGELPEAHPRRKTLNLIKVLAAQKETAKKIVTIQYQK